MTSIARVARGGSVAMVTHIGSIELPSLAIAVGGSENDAATYVLK